jgi:hypothetical protein
LGQDNDFAHLVITRPSLMYATETARVSVDGIPTCSLMPHGDCEVNIPAGQVAVSVSMPLAFGVSTLSWNALDGQTYQVVLRHRGMAALAAGAFLGAFGGPLGAAAGAGIGSTINQGQGAPLIVALVSP